MTTERPTSTAIPTAGTTPAQLKTTTSTTTRAPAITGLLSLEKIQDKLKDKFMTAIQWQENQEFSYFEAVAKNPQWKVSSFHAITEVNLTKQSAQKVKEELIEERKA
ncbi:uncharacterized protein LOC125941143 [Dermacentor silvarum]|uniref:uncharacterized protein LOC125941143 n=1 Tax=Dermacentor silvarum TaxID=543639 RepID=UPI0021010570|nr:uncharacterized protein LOC125941143 [Dermacentor silvarum]